jgi:hypothetical protein
MIRTGERIDHPSTSRSDERTLLRGTVSQDHEVNEHLPQDWHHHACANLFGCGDEKGVDCPRGLILKDAKAEYALLVTW